MHEQLVNKIESYLADNNMPVNEFERKAGLKRSSISNILHGKSKNPSIEILSAIAKQFGQSFEELTGQKVTIKPSEKKYNLNINIALKSFNALSGNLSEQTPIDSKKFFDCVKELHDYSVVNNIDEVDNRYARWLTQNKLDPEC